MKYFFTQTYSVLHGMTENVIAAIFGNNTHTHTHTHTHTRINSYNLIKQSKMAQKRATNMDGRGRAFDNSPSNISKHRVDQSDSAFAGLVKLLYGVLHCIHHIAILEENMANSSLPKALEKKVNDLNSFIKPARSNLDITFDLNLTI